MASAFTSLRRLYHGAIDPKSSGLTFRIPMLLHLLKPRLSKVRNKASVPWLDEGLISPITLVFSHLRKDAIDGLSGIPS